MENMKIMVIDDEKTLLADISEYFKDYSLVTFFNPVTALAELKKKYYDIIIVDYRMPCMTGIELLYEAKKADTYTYGILFTAYADKEILEKALNRNLVSRLVEKPLRLKQLKLVIDEAISECRKKLENRIKLEKYDSLVREFSVEESQIIGLDRGLKNVYEQVKSVSSYPVPVLISG